MGRNRGTRDAAHAAKVRYAVVGTGHISQVAALPAFKGARRNSVLAALISGDPMKRRELGQRYDVPGYPYEQFEECLSTEAVDAVYIGLPNNQHCGYTERAARAGVHVLCEKPMAVTVQECERMHRATDAAGVKLMIAYRLHFEPANMRAVEIAESGEIGSVRIFESTFTMQVKPDNIRVKAEKGGGPLYDIGVYCIQAARYLFGAEPTRVYAVSASSGDPRFEEIHEMVSAVLRFPDDRLAAFTCSFGASAVSSYRLVGTRGDLRVEPAYGYVEPLKHHLTVDEKTRTKIFRKRDQFAAELLYFSDCILEDVVPEPSGVEGTIDVEIIQALQHAAETEVPVDLPVFPAHPRPGPGQARYVRPARKPPLVHAESSSE